LKRESATAIELKKGAFHAPCNDGAGNFHGLGPRFSQRGSGGLSERARRQKGEQVQGTLEAMGHE
jgi:hypothetical protein